MKTNPLFKTVKRQCKRLSVLMQAASRNAIVIAEIG
jgi:hypothetical protein